MILGGGSLLVRGHGRIHSCACGVGTRRIMHVKATG